MDKGTKINKSTSIEKIKISKQTIIYLLIGIIVIMSMAWIQNYNNRILDEKLETEYENGYANATQNILNSILNDAITLDGELTCNTLDIPVQTDQGENIFQFIPVACVVQ